MQRIWFILFGLMFLYFGVKMDIQSTEIRSKCDIVKSEVILADKVVKVVNNQNNSEYSQDFSVEFDYNRGTYIHSFNNIDVSNSIGYKVGDRLKIFVDRSNPKEVYMYKSRTQSYISYAVAFILVVIGIRRKRDNLGDKK